METFAQLGGSARAGSGGGGGWSSLDGSLNAPGDTGDARYTFYQNPLNAAGALVNPLTVYGAHRPPWKVAGVDYPVGIKPSALPLKVPGVNAMPSGATYNGTSQITISASGTVLDGWDLSINGGINVFVSDGTVTGVVVSDCYVHPTTNTADSFDCNGNPGITIQYCAINANAVVTNSATVIKNCWTIAYSFILGAGQDNINYGSAQPGLGATAQGLFFKFSAIIDGGANPGTHGDWYQEGGPVGGGLPWNPNATFNFFWQRGAGGPYPNQGTQGWMFEPNGGATIIGSFVNNTVVTALDAGSTTPVNFWSGIDDSGVSGGVVVSPGINIQDNYVDPTGCSGSVRLTSPGNFGTLVQVNGNVNMLNGLSDAAGGFNHYP